MQRIYIARWAITRGILETDVDEGDISENGYVYIHAKRFVVGPKDWANSFEVAQERARTKRALAIAAAKRKLTRLKSLEFRASRPL